MHTEHSTRVPCGALCGRSAPRVALFGPSRVCLVCLPASQARRAPRAAPAGLVRQSRAAPAGQGSLFG